MSRKVLIINGSYRANGITDQTLQLMAATLHAHNIRHETIQLRDYPLKFCINCRECTQQPGKEPGHCIQSDDMQALISKIEAADAYILASPTNFGTVTALYKRFMERLVVYSYWPWGAPAPQYRKATLPPKKAIIISSSGAPGWLGRWAFSTVSQLKQTAKTIGAKPVGTLFNGMASQKTRRGLSAATQQKARALALKLV